MQLPVVVFALIVLVAVLVKSGDVSVSPSKEELLDELTEKLLVRYLESREQDKGVQNANTRDGYKDGPVRRWWLKPDVAKFVSGGNIGNILNHNYNQGNGYKSDYNPSG